MPNVKFIWILCPKKRRIRCHAYGRSRHDSSDKSNGQKRTTKKNRKTLIASRFVLNRILKGEKFVDISKIKTEWLANDLHKEVFDWAKTMPEHTDLVNPMFSKFGYENDEINKILNVNMKFADTIREADYFNDCVLMLANEFVSKRLEQVKNGYNELSDPEAKRASIAEISRLQKILKSKDINDKL